MFINEFGQRLSGIGWKSMGMSSLSRVEETGAGTGRRISVTSLIVLKRELSVNVMLFMLLVDLISFPSWP